jgi:hypothetical protein
MIECMNGPEGCQGAVEMRTGDGLRFWPRCLRHFEEYLDSMARARVIESSVAPAWFDEGNAGERWDDDY